MGYKDGPFLKKSGIFSAWMGFEYEMLVHINGLENEILHIDGGFRTNF